MTEETYSRTPRTEHRSVSYRLPPGANVLVRLGQMIGREGLLARVPRKPLIQSYAADLDTTLPEATAALSIRDGTRVRGGETVARHRSGFRVRTLNAATNGVITVRPHHGLYTLAPVVPTEIVSRFSGTVRSITPDEIIIVSLIEQFHLSFASSGATAEGTLLALLDPRTLPSSAIPEVLLIPHLAAFTALREPGRAGIPLVIACTVTDRIAWELLTARTREGTPVRQTPHVATIAGPGNAAEGEQLFDRLRVWDGRDVWLEDGGGTLALCAEARLGHHIPAPLPTTITLRDPAHWGQRAQIVTTESNAPLHPGLTRTVRIATIGHLVVPVQNGEILVDESH